MGTERFAPGARVFIIPKGRWGKYAYVDRYQSDVHGIYGVDDNNDTGWYKGKELLTEEEYIFSRNTPGKEYHSGNLSLFCY
jgi:hypothetical protein